MYLFEQNGNRYAEGSRSRTEVLPNDRRRAGRADSQGGAAGAEDQRRYGNCLSTYLLILILSRTFFLALASL